MTEATERIDVTEDALATADAGVSVGASRSMKVTDRCDRGGAVYTVDDDGGGGDALATAERRSGHCRCCCLCRWKETDGGD